MGAVTLPYIHYVFITVCVGTHACASVHTDTRTTRRDVRPPNPCCRRSNLARSYHCAVISPAECNTVATEKLSCGVWGSNPGRDEILRTRPDGPWGPPSSNKMGTGFSPGGKAAGTWCWPPTPHVGRGKRKSRTIPLLPLRAFMAWSRANSTFTFYDKPQRYDHFGNVVNSPRLAEHLKH